MPCLLVEFCQARARGNKHARIVSVTAVVRAGPVFCGITLSIFWLAAKSLNGGDILVDEYWDKPRLLFCFVGGYLEGTAHSVALRQGETPSNVLVGCHA